LVPKIRRLGENGRDLPQIEDDWIIEEVRRICLILSARLGVYQVSFGLAVPDLPQTLRKT
jgi:hypothetical protein